jgi:hypothetical protein
LQGWAYYHRDVELGDAKWSDSELALRAVYCHAVYYAANRVSSLAKADIDKEVEEHRQRANRLRKESARMRGGEGSEGSHHASALDEAAAYCDEQADLMYFFNRGLITKRHQGDPEIRGYCMMLVDEMRRVYGHEMRGSVAAIANSVFALRTLTDQRIRDWIKGAVN